MIKPKKRVYNDGRTKQAFKNDTDINRLLAKAKKAGSLSHLQKYEPVYGDFAAFDFAEAQNQLARGRSIFEDLPAEMRQDFGQDPGQFFKFVNDPENRGKLREIFPQIAEPGLFFPDMKGTTPPGTLSGDTAGVETPASDTPTTGSEAVTEAVSASGG